MEFQDLLKPYNALRQCSLLMIDDLVESWEGLWMGLVLKIESGPLPAFLFHPKCTKLEISSPDILSLA
jgi:hypothetical protein